VSGLSSTGILSGRQLNAVSDRLLSPLTRIDSATRFVTGAGGGFPNTISSSALSSGFSSGLDYGVKSFK
jgi:hypothetical protein